jgi:uncharacterized Zn-binding protein involved in type VI secretion
MFGVARLGDRTKGRCTCHASAIDVGGTIVSASPTTTVDMFPVARLGDLILADCGHKAVIVTSSSVTFADGLGVARLGDLGASECYKCTIVTASSLEFTA